MHATVDTLEVYANIEIHPEFVHYKLIQNLVMFTTFAAFPHT